MVKPSATPAEIGEAFARMGRLQEDLARRQQAIGRKAQLLARGLARLMEPGHSYYRRGVGLQAISVGDEICLAASYLKQEVDDRGYRYAVLCGGEAARRALRSAVLDQGRLRRAWPWPADGACFARRRSVRRSASDLHYERDARP